MSSKTLAELNKSCVNDKWFWSILEDFLATEINQDINGTALEENQTCLN